jgi:hypothetical protein
MFLSLVIKLFDSILRADIFNFNARVLRRRLLLLLLWFCGFLLWRLARKSASGHEKKCQTKLRQLHGSPPQACSDR